MGDLHFDMGDQHSHFGPHDMASHTATTTPMTATTTPTRVKIASLDQPSFIELVVRLAKDGLVFGVGKERTSGAETSRARLEVHKRIIAWCKLLYSGEVLAGLLIAIVLGHHQFLFAKEFSMDAALPEVCLERR